uniref:Uncharacterized protein n=1 Tax=Lepeophtheirus salmonis TaxID=72036 RepID=A0A0K2U6Z0_LEPSM
MLCVPLYNRDKIPHSHQETSK